MSSVSDYSSLGVSTVLGTQPKRKPVGVNKQDLSIGVPSEVSNQENRVGLTPDAVSILVKNGHSIIVETDAGINAGFSNQEYSEAGAQIAYSKKEVFDAHIIIKVEPLTQEEVDLLHTEQVLFSALNLPSLDQKYFNALVQKRVTSIAYEYLEDKGGDLPVVRAMSEIAGSSSILIASEYLSKDHKGKGLLLGGITGVPPTSVVIIGAGTVAEYAARTALGLGAEIKVFDTHLYRLQRLKYAVGHGIFTSIIDSKTLTDALCQADVVIGAMRSEKGFAPMVVSEEMVAEMKDGSVIIDVAIDNGGCIETSRMMSLEKPTYISHGVRHFCVPNIASRVSYTASMALSNIFTPMLIKAGNIGGIDEMILSNSWFMKGVYTYKGNVTHTHIAKKFNLRYRELQLLLAARF